MKVVGVGAGEHARVVIDVLQCQGCFEIVGLTDPRPELHGNLVLGVPILGGDDLLPGLYAQGVTAAFLGMGGIGDNRPRAGLFERVRALGFSLINAIHPAAVVARSASLGQGVAIMAGAVINPGVRLGDNVIVNTGAILDHDCEIGDHAHISPGVAFSGTVRIGRLTHVGTGARIRQGVTVGEGTLIGVGAAVVGDIPAGVVAVGVPARVLRTVKNGP